MSGLRKDLITATIAIVFLTLLLGVAYPLLTTGVSQVLFPNASNGSKIEVDGKVVGSKLIGQDFRGLPRYFQGRPSVTEYSADVTYFNNLGPEQQGTVRILRRRTEGLPGARAPLRPRPDRRRRARRRGHHLGLRRRPPDLRGQRPHPGAPGRGGPRPAARRGSSTWSTRTPTAASSASSASPASTSSSSTSPSTRKRRR